MQSNECVPSTTWSYKKVKISRRLQGSAAQGPKGSSGPKRPHVDPKTPHSIRITYRGGAEAWWFIEYQGEGYVAPGHMAIHDVFSWFLDGNRGVSLGRQGGRSRAASGAAGSQSSRRRPRR